VHDPSVVLRDDGTYFRFSTLDGINIATASSIDGPWTHQGSVLPNGSVIDLPGNKDLWAPDCFFYDGLYYLYYAVSTSGSQDSDIGLATSTTMETGSWTDHGSIGIPANSDYNKIDPNLFHYSTSSPFYLSFGSYWDGIYQVPMSTPPTKVNGDAVHLEQNTTSRPDNLPVDPNEGSYQFWWNVDSTDYYYLFFSSGTCCNEPPDLVPQGEEYHVMVCRSTEPTGGFVDQEGNDCLTDNGGTLVLASHDDVYAPGGQGT
jgi:arabinan endo-1,5-alpha-L-arabinosidase